MAEAAFDAGMTGAKFDALLRRIARDPERAFEDLRELLFDATLALLECHSVEEAMKALAPFDAHPYGPLLHHYEVSNWVLFARAYGKKGSAKKVLALDAKLRAAPVALDVLVEQWVLPRLAEG